MAEQRDTGPSTVAGPRLRRADGVEFDLVGVRSMIGRDPGHAVHLSETAVSRAHAEVQRTDHGFQLRDLGSRNGTFVNGRRIDRRPVPLRHDDEIVVAGVETFRFIDPMATPPVSAAGRLTGVWIDRSTRAVFVDGRRVDPPLSARQQALVELLVERSGALVSRTEVVEVVWADVAADGVSAAAVEALIKRLRARLRGEPNHTDYLEVHRGRGVRLRSPER